MANNKTMTPYGGRVKLLQKRIKSWSVDALLVTNAKDINYLTGFCGHDSWALVLCRSAKVFVFSDARFEEQIEREAPEVKKIIRRDKGLADEVAKVCKAKKLGQIGLQGVYVTLDLKKLMDGKIGRKNLVLVDDGMLLQRGIKDTWEIKAVSKAVKIQEAAFVATVASLRVGQSELEICARLEYEMKMRGGGTGFDPIIAVGANAALPHAIPGKTKLKKNGMLLIDWGSIYGDYISDMTRTLLLGKPKKVQIEIYKIVLEANEAAIDAIAPGVAIKEIDAIARDIIRKAGYGKAFGHSLGHGIGLDVHEHPGVSGRSSGVLEPGQIITVEPGIYLPGIGGVRIEDDILVTKSGKKNLCSLPKDLKSAMICI